MSVALTAPSRARTARADVAIVTSRAALAGAFDAARSAGRSVGLVPTMGALHAGHRSLIDRAVAECDLVAVTNFVNPTQFGDASDLAEYPRTLEADLEVAARAGADLMFVPSVEEMYPGWPASKGTALVAPAPSRRWEGASRPGHFDGVVTVVAKLLAPAGRCRAYFGEKDYQQLVVVQHLVSDLGLPVEIVGCPIVREPDGLALSSRNVRLAPSERTAAPVLQRALVAGATAMAAGEHRTAHVEAAMAAAACDAPEVALDYAVAVDAQDLEPAVTCAPGRPLRLLIAATVGPVRLIDNLDPRPLPGP